MGLCFSSELNLLESQHCCVSELLPAFSRHWQGECNKTNGIGSSIHSNSAALTSKHEVRCQGEEVITAVSKLVMPLGAHLRENSNPVAGVCQGLIGTHTEGHQLQQLWQLNGYVKMCKQIQSLKERTNAERRHLQGVGKEDSLIWFVLLQKTYST